MTANIYSYILYNIYIIFCATAGFLYKKFELNMNEIEKSFEYYLTSEFVAYQVNVVVLRC
jgi:hypothetical protein